MKRNFQSLRSFLGGVLLAGLAERALTVALVGQNPPPVSGPHYDVVEQNRTLANIPGPPSLETYATQTAKGSTTYVSLMPDKPRGEANYVLLTPDKHKFIPSKGYTLLICLHGSLDTAGNFAKFWMALVNSRPDVLVAVPEADSLGSRLDAHGRATLGYDWHQTPTALITAVINDTVAHDHVNPQHIFLVRYSGGDEGNASDEVVGTHPELFAGFADISGAFDLDVSNPVWKGTKFGGLDRDFFTPALKKSAGKMAMFFSQGTQATSDKLFAAQVAQLKNFGFTSLSTDRPDCGRNIPMAVFNQMTERMMNFFTRVLETNEQKEKKAVTPKK